MKDIRGMPWVDPRKFEVYKLLSSGRTLNEITQIMFISKNTLKVHRYNARKQYGASTDAHLMVMLKDAGLI